MLGALLLALPGATPPLLAESGVWTPVGPEGGTVLGLGISPLTGTTYAATANAEVLKRASGAAAAWAPARAGIAASFYSAILTLLVGAANPDHLYALTYTIVYSSRDGGATWSDTGLHGQFFGDRRRQVRTR